MMFTKAFVLLSVVVCLSLQGTSALDEESSIKKIRAALTESRNEDAHSRPMRPNLPDVENRLQVPEGQKEGHDVNQKLTKGNCNNVRMVSRAEWGASAAYCWAYQAFPNGFYIVHHTVGNSCWDLNSCSAEVRSIQYYHAVVLQWCDIGYNFLIGNDGRVYEGTGWDYQGTHTICYSHDGIGVSFMGNYQWSLPSNAAIQAARDLLDCAQQRGELTWNYQLGGHRDYNWGTDCPGHSLYAEIQSWPEFYWGHIVQC